ncbi:MAG TPA: sigma-54 dependent transcriptional regulator [Fimbriimonadales bacterium]|nr:sigma-54 dependent transcriptional regulator [Fimbriimonadales bacterium]
MSKSKILIVDDENNIRKILVAAFERAGWTAVAEENAEAALSKLEEGSYHLILTDVLMPGMNGMEFLNAVKQKHPEIPVIVMTAYGTIPQAVEAMRAGAADYITKPFDLEQLKKTIAFWLRTQNKRTPTRPREEKTCLENIVAVSQPMKNVLDFVQRVADSRATVLITGESGTGKEVIARAIHRCSARANAPFVAVSCAAIPETLLESELFGHEKGAFTGADHARPGRFEMADGGTLFLDEIGEVPPLIQVKLLRVLQEREFERLGGRNPIRVDVRLISATNRDLQEAVEERTFRQDLYFRLQVLQIEIPPLRERRDDIAPLALHFLNKYAPENGSSMRELDPEALRCFLDYPWPGNVRELENVIERAVVLAPKNIERLTPEFLPMGIRQVA